MVFQLTYFIYSYFFWWIVGKYIQLYVTLYYLSFYILYLIMWYIYDYVILRFYTETWVKQALIHERKALIQMFDPGLMYLWHQHSWIALIHYHDLRI